MILFHGVRIPILRQARAATHSKSWRDLLNQNYSLREKQHRVIIKLPFMERTYQEYALRKKFGMHSALVSY